MAPDQPNRDPYEVLGVDPTASASQVTSAYRRLVRDLHPDSRSDPGVTDTARLGEVLAAYEVLGDPARRAAYDERRHRRPAAGSSSRGVEIRVRRVEQEPPSRDTTVLRAGPARFQPQSAPRRRRTDRVARASPLDLLGDIETLFRRWW